MSVLFARPALAAGSSPLRDQDAEAGLSAKASADRISAARTLGAEGAGGSAAAVRSALRAEKDPQTRAVLLGTLGLLKPDATILADLEKALADKDITVRLEAVGALGRLPAATGTADLVSELKNDPDAGVRQLAALRLTGTQDDAAVAALILALAKDKSAAVRLQAAAAVGALWEKRKDVRDALTQAKKSDSDAGVRKMVQAVSGGRL